MRKPRYGTMHVTATALILYKNPSITVRDTATRVIHRLAEHATITRVPAAAGRVQAPGAATHTESHFCCPGS